MANGMQYTTMGAKKGELNPKSLYMNSLNFDKQEKERLELEAKDQQEKEAMEAVWAKYKALAEGRHEKPQAEDKAPAQAKPAKIEAAQAPAPGKGFGILDQYERIKARRSQMKMITINRPDAEKPQETDEKKEAPESK